ncbi:hypothetical protein A2625_00820 [candidate division WOR-1 bacterium RIFCSPHIGHO2_01_FULL_53_15]|uniref:Succinate dehydrogenase, cytochrome b556 subunit n=1 Tax=candidate division WOR-1 bacterium RIFCSPHIGHO2_01_FULL_53_15 TaxID=1802564 RepID=A0A1F4Q3R0_UNCSA|nr:MAG: hypothetical protein A2625_00820 [candidate division WOR-1 bacterium RIFCSPHIGHO2_01_FULL_53_15]OGC12707.1 MAG: hypothetical protein A3D23_03085 [candidate division WOR-1 bacterium RIFCSPHIGHO2_02_FULL_53_26]
MKYNKSSLLWLLQRISAVLIFSALGAHIWKVHYVELGQPILYAGVALRLKDVMTLALDSSILFLGLFHGLNGVRMVALDYDFLKKHDRLISWLLVIVGAAFFILGVRGLWAFLINIK